MLPHTVPVQESVNPRALNAIMCTLLHRISYTSANKCEKYAYLRSQYSDSLRAGRSRDQIPARARFSASVQTGPGAHPASYAVDTGSLSREQSGRGVALTIHPHLAPRLKKE